MPNLSWSTFLPRYVYKGLLAIHHVLWVETLQYSLLQPGSDANFRITTKSALSALASQMGATLADGLHRMYVTLLNHAIMR